MSQNSDTTKYKTTYTAFHRDLMELLDKHGIVEYTLEGSLNESDEPVLRLDIEGVEDDVR